MPIVPLVRTEGELRTYIARLKTLIRNNPMTAGDQTRRVNEAQIELNNLLLSQGGYSVTNDAEVAASVATARAEGHAAGIAEAKAAAEAALNAA